MLAEISWTSKEAALRLISMPFLTSIEVADRKAMEYLLRLADSGPNRLDMFLSKAEINDGITDENAWLIPLMYLRAVDEESAEAIEGMPWVADGIAFFEPDSTLWIHPNPARYEEEIVGLLVNGATESPRLIKALTERPWLWTAPSYRGNRVVTLLIGIAREHEQTALKILEMPFLETIDAYDEVALTSLGAISGLHPDRLNAVLADPRLAGGITDETSVLTGLMWLELDDPPTASALSALPWIADGITAEEVDAALLLQELAVEAPRVARALAQKPWTADGVSDDEYSVIWASMAMSWAPVSEVCHSLVLDIFDMPFLDSVEPADTAAVWSLQELSWEFNEGQMRPLLFHPALQGGITDAQAIVVGTFSIVLPDKPELLDVLLDPDRHTVEQRTVRLPLAGGVAIAVVRTVPGKAGTIDVFEEVLRFQEQFLDVPFPENFILLLVGDGLPGQLGLGTYGFTTLPPWLAEDLYTISRKTAREYWPFPPRWINHGASEFTATMTERTMAGKELSPYRSQCEFAKNIPEVDALFHSDDQAEYDLVYDWECYKDFGMQLFTGLYLELGEQEFRRGFKDLYVGLDTDSRKGECVEDTGDWGLCYLKTAFVENASTDQSA